MVITPALLATAARLALSAQQLALLHGIPLNLGAIGGSAAGAAGAGGTVLGVPTGVVIGVGIAAGAAAAAGGGGGGNSTTTHH